MRRKKVSMDKLFGYKEEAVVTRESWGVDLQPLAPVANESKKRQKTASTVPKKKAKIERGAEDITDETTKQLATELLDQIETTPGRIILNFSSTKSSEVCPLPPSFNQNVKSNWSIDNLKERQLSGLLDQNCKSFKPLGIKKIQKVKTEEETLPRQLDLKQTIAKLKNEDKKDDEYVGFSVAIANVLRRCEPKIAEKLAQSIVALLETDASSVVHKM
ncbi:Protein CBR-ADBP-1.2 [Caenorhabditis briggsae]|uniref:Protein CBG22318 n=2 Tax=Caenorhabditis briggsae TaxID=6238 RepID=A8Y223_CAEBR|nr:Protein CBG22318 [Caenorhabditis briggsae]XP_045100831.1 Protein CBR-ADBP-1.2 [Caenorhabditis briggsae]ULT96101.1 hypothetical protein L3Y34_004618 [Caenorhabditis briggsae]UMM29293.1 hypothetical protein L5515_011726 [Caenorhabditis briggsae]CAP38943.2 Protein CBG22318 [Caenorhabditis briggsae]CCG58541.1 Protein CBR-ADBP-1.2 [Caenorhabditis briggsae]